MTQPFGKTVLQKNSMSIRRLPFAVMSLFCLALILRNSELAVRYMTYGLRLCAVSVIPSVFPFMVLSEWIVSFGALQTIGRLLERPFRFLFGVGGDSAGALLLGWLCGFPIGTRTALSLYRRGNIDRRELSRVLTFSNIPSSAFLIGAVGITLFGDRHFGVRLYIVSLLSAVTIGIAEHLFEKLPAKKKKISAKSSFSPDSRPSSAARVSGFTDAIASSAIAILQICAFVVFFSVLSGTVSYVFSAWHLPTELTCLLFGFLELTGGTAKAAELAPPLSELFCAFFAGWSGCSVHCQLIGLCSETDLSLRPYFFAKWAHGCLNVLFFLLFRMLSL